jgi:hypothetical protein
MRFFLRFPTGCRRGIHSILIFNDIGRRFVPEWYGFKVIGWMLHRSFVRRFIGLSHRPCRLAAVCRLLGSGLAFVLAPALVKQSRHFRTEFQRWTLLRRRGAFCNCRGCLLILLRLPRILTITNWRCSTRGIPPMIRRRRRMRMTRRLWNVIRIFVIGRLRRIGM